jgi:methionyl-tRNA formyltransferase
VDCPVPCGKIGQSFKVALSVMSLRLAFLGTPDFAVPTLEALLQSRHQLIAVYCQPPRPAGRGLLARASPVMEKAKQSGIEVRTPRSLRGTSEQAAFAALGLDAAVVVAYGLLLPAPILVAPKGGCLNLHPSRLPRWRGAAPIQRCLMAGDTETAVAIMRVDEGLDTGPVCLEEAVAVPEAATAGDMHDELARRGARLMVEALDQLEAGRLDCHDQAGHGVTYAAKISKDEAHIDWRRSAKEVHDHIRGLSPFPGAWCLAERAGNERIKILRSKVAEGSGAAGAILVAEGASLIVGCGSGAVRLLEVQRAGRKPMSAAEVLRGFPLRAGSQLT